MSERKINLEEILQDFGIYNNSTHPNEEIREKYLIIVAVMKEACRQTLELAAENAETIWGQMVVKVNKQSILNTINQIE